MNTINHLDSSTNQISSNNSLEIPKLKIDVKDNGIIRFLESYRKINNKRNRTIDRKENRAINRNLKLIKKLILCKDLNEVVEILIEDSDLKSLIDIIKSTDFSIEIRKILVEKLNKQTTQERGYTRYKIDGIKGEVIIFRNGVIVYGEEISIINHGSIKVIDGEYEEIYTFRGLKY